MAPLPRLHLFEFNDASWAPDALREGIVDALSVTLERGRMLDGLVGPFGEFLEAAGTQRVLDLCAGAGGPARVLARALGQQGITPQITLTDLHPRLDAWRQLEAEFPNQIDSVDTPVDATLVSPELSSGRARVIINALHHFPPPLVEAMLRDAVGSGEGIFIAEGFGRDPRGFLTFAPAGLPALAGVPLRGDRRLLKALLFWGTPIGLIASIWDGLVSTFRIHTEADLRRYVAPLGGDYDWRFGWYSIPPWGRGYWFSGVPSRRVTPGGGPEVPPGRPKR